MIEFFLIPFWRLWLLLMLILFFNMLVIFFIEVIVHYFGDDLSLFCLVLTHE